jgi:hypothetical protein
MQYITQCPHYSRLITRRFRENNYLLFQIVKERADLVGLDGFEPSTPALSRRCSNQLSYRPVRSLVEVQPIEVGSCGSACLRKEVIQPHLPIRLPCYDFTPVMNLTVVGALLAVRRPASGETHSHGVTGGVYKTRERIHRDMLIRDY